MEEILRALPGRLLPWFRANRRDLPWRRDREPYHIWLSEIMLQQTRVEAVKGYYSRFLDRLPTIAALAEAPEDELHKLWEGLGYYSRVRNLKKAAQVILEQHGGCFPEEYEKILALPGVGEYTAGAVASIAFGQRRAAVDGNVLRVLSRLLADETPIDTPQAKAAAKTRLEEIYPQEAGDFTQALMELGATVCLPNGAPDCARCPMAELCRARTGELWRSLPRKLPKRSRRQEQRTVFVLCCGDLVALQRRENKGLLAGLWQFPNVSGHLEAQEAMEQAEAWGCRPRRLRRRAEREHIFTHIRWELRAYRIDCEAAAEGFTWLTRSQVEQEAALPTAFRQFWDLTQEDAL